jgi:hypothetical protein
MMMRLPVSRSTLALAALGLLPACTPLDLDDPRTARVDLQGPEGGSLQIVTSSAFFVDENRELTDVLSADTTRVTLPFSGEFDVGVHDGNYKFYVEVRSEEGESLTTRLRVTVGGYTWYDAALDMQEWRHRFYYMR